MSCLRGPLTLSPARPTYPTAFTAYLHIGGISERMAPETFDLAGVYAKGYSRRLPDLSGS
jgi:hypothetical protein